MTKKFAIALICLIIPVVGFVFCEDAKPVKTLEKAADYRIIRNVKIVRKIELPRAYHEGILLNGGYMLINNGYEENTWVLDLQSGKVASEIVPPGTFTEAVTPAPGGKYWVSDWYAKSLYLAKIDKNKLIPERKISLEPSHPAGVLWNGEHLYLITWTRGMGTKYHLIKMDREGNMLDKILITNIAEPSQLAWDGESLWISSFFQRRVYKIDEKNLKIKRYFRFPVKDITGIAWEGKYLWLTGASADLYKLEISE